MVTSEPKDSQEEVIFLQQELSELGTAIKEEKWYSGQLKDELDKVAKERDKLEEVFFKKSYGIFIISFGIDSINLKFILINV